MISSLTHSLMDSSPLFYEQLSPIKLFDKISQADLYIHNTFHSVFEDMNF